jgi:hypothetical protein
LHQVVGEGIVVIEDKNHCYQITSAAGLGVPRVCFELGATDKLLIVNGRLQLALDRPLTKLHAYRV